MDRCAIFVDAGYLYAEAGRLCHGTTQRKDLVLDAPAATELLVGEATKSCGLPVLRTYWYDGAKDSIPTAAQRAIGMLPNVKLRLGRLNTKNQQKGVDALIYRDLITLSRERSITDAFLLSGDEDLREGVKTAQDQGVRVTLIGIKPNKGYNQSRTLVEEVDELIRLTKAELASIISRVTPAAVAAAAGVAPVAAVPPPAASTAHPAWVAGERFAQAWLAKATTSDIQALQAVRSRRIPKLLDMELLLATEGAIGSSIKGDDEAHKQMRKGFWQEIKAATPSP